MSRKRQKGCAARKRAVAQRLMRTVSIICKSLTRLLPSEKLSTALCRWLKRISSDQRSHNNALPCHPKPYSNAPPTKVPAEGAPQMPYTSSWDELIYSAYEESSRRRILAKASFIKKFFLCGAYAPRCFDCAHAPLNMTIKKSTSSWALLQRPTYEGSSRQAYTNRNQITKEGDCRRIIPHPTTRTKAAARPKILRRLLTISYTTIT